MRAEGGLDTVSGAEGDGLKKYGEETGGSES